MKTTDIRRLVIRSYHVTEAEFSEKAGFKEGRLCLPELPETTEDLIKDTKIEIIKSDQHERYVDTIMDIIPISAKVLGRLGQGITHTFTGIYVMLTGKDEDGNQMHEFGSSEGILSQKMKPGRCGTPGENDLIIHISVLLKGGQPFDRKLTNQAFTYADRYIMKLREVLKGLDAKDASEVHEYFDRIREGALKVVLVKQVAAQGAMYDNMVYPSEPSGADGISVIDTQCMPLILSPNEYRDGAIRAMT